MSAPIFIEANSARLAGLGRLGDGVTDAATAGGILDVFKTVFGGGGGAGASKSFTDSLRALQAGDVARAQGKQMTMMVVGGVLALAAIGGIGYLAMRASKS